MALFCRLLAGLCALLGCACGVFDGDDTVAVPGEDFRLDCHLYCAVVMRRCTGSATPFFTLPACMDACTHYPTDGPFGASSGDSLQCRFTFALAARRHTAHAFCRNAGASGGLSCR